MPQTPRLPSAGTCWRAGEIRVRCLAQPARFGLAPRGRHLILLSYSCIPLDVPDRLARFEHSRAGTGGLLGLILMGEVGITAGRIAPADTRSDRLRAIIDSVVSTAADVHDLGVDGVESLNQASRMAAANLGGGIPGGLPFSRHKLLDSVSHEKTSVCWTEVAREKPPSLPCSTEVEGK